MTDLISLEAAIEAAYQGLKEPANSETWQRILDRLMAVQPEGMNQTQQCADKQQWIPVSKRLPEERGFYLTTTKDKAVYCDYWNEMYFERTEMVIAWMPLPEPYQWEGA